MLTLRKREISFYLFRFISIMSYTSCVLRPVQSCGRHQNRPWCGRKPIVVHQSKVSRDVAVYVRLIFSASGSRHRVESVAWLRRGQAPREGAKETQFATAQLQQPTSNQVSVVRMRRVQCGGSRYPFFATSRQFRNLFQSYPRYTIGKTSTAMRATIYTPCCCDGLLLDARSVALQAHIQYQRRCPRAIRDRGAINRDAIDSNKPPVFTTESPPAYRHQETSPTYSPA
jgi:hypothetical protein